MKKIFFLLIASCIGFVASAQTLFQPDGSSSFTGANTYCVGAPITTPLTFEYTTCNTGTGIPTGLSCNVYWYYNTTNSTTVAGATLASGPIPFTAATSATGSLTYTPALSVGGMYYFFCVIEWTGGGSPMCGGTAGSFVSSTTQLVSISPAPIAPTAPVSVCIGSTVTLTNSFPGGTWTSANPGVVTIDTNTGVATGMTFGGSTITYQLGGCSVTSFMYCYDNPSPITPLGPVTVCVASTANLGSATSGGTWSSTVPTVATVGLTSGTASAFGVGTTIISYIIPSTGCYAVKEITVNPNPAPIAGNNNVCIAGTTTLTDATTPGNWYSSTPARATVGATTGIVSGLSAGTTRISYILSTTGCFSIMTMNVNTAPAAISGPSSLCATNTMTLTDAVAGGTWNSSNTGLATVDLMTGLVTGLGVGILNISYTTAGCTPVSKTITVNTLPGAISGVFFTCYGDTTNLSSTSFPGIWKSSDTTVAWVDTLSGRVAGLSMGTTTITYRVTTSGCFVTRTVSVYPLAPILGWDTVCVGSDISLTNIVGGGTWVSSNPAIAGIDTFTGHVTGIFEGITYIKYHLPTGCQTTKFLRVIPSLPAIGGPLVFCSGSAVSLSNGITGGTWSSSNIYVAEVDPVTGITSGHTADVATISYSIYGCLTTSEVTVNALPEPTLTYDWVTRKLTTPPVHVSYQWFDSSSGPIPGATNNFITLPNLRDNYYVVVTDGNGCSAPTDWFKFPLGLNELDAAAPIHVYPNPAIDVIYIDAPLHSRATITGMEGRILLETDNTKEVNISKLPAGMYILNVYDKLGNTLAVEKLVKQ
jgi:uncharacterized protein YjdB